MKPITALCLIMFLPFQVILSQSAPETIDDSYSTALNTILNINEADGLLQNDSDADGDNLVVESFVVNGTVYPAGQTVNTLGGSVTINQDGSLTYNPSGGFEGTVPVIAYFVSDGTTISAGHLSLTITSPGPPEAQDDYDTADINTTLNVPAPGVLGNDTFEDEDSIAVVSFTVNGVTYNPGDTVNLGSGDFTLQADGSFIFNPAPGFTGYLPLISYTISDANGTSEANLFLGVEDVENLIQLQGFSSCNQGYTVNGNYRIEYTFSFGNLSTARDYHTSSLIKTVDLIKDLDNIYGNGCVIEVDDLTISTSSPFDYIDNPYPMDFDLDSANQDFVDGISANVFNSENINEAILYPRQIVTISYCIVIEPFCGGRPNPTPSGSGIDFEAVLDITSSTDPTDTSLLLTDFHTSEAILTAGINIPETSPEENPDGTFDYENYVIITNQGSSTANNINFNMGLGSFIDNTVDFNTLTVSQISGPPVTVNTNYDGDTNTNLLAPNNSLAPGETIVLEIFHLTEPVSVSANFPFPQVNPSMTQGDLDGFDESTPENQKLYSFVTWEDGLGNHLDRYYLSDATNSTATNDQCDCSEQSLFLGFTSTASSEKIITSTNPSPNGILEHEEYTFEFTFTNLSPIVDLNNLQLQEDLSAICNDSPVFVGSPQIVFSTATTDPNLNPNFDGDTDVNIFDGNSGLLTTNESITVELTVILLEDCIGDNTIIFSATDPAGILTTSESEVSVDAFTDSDNDGISNVIDIDDDNDTIPDIEEYGGLDPLDDHDGDSIPNYRDTDYGVDANNDGIVDIFDFDGDGVPNHLDLDSDGDGIYDIDEAGNQDLDTDNDGRTNNPVGENGLDNTVETDDTESAAITYTIINSDNDPNPNYLDIDSDADGIVDNIEAQPTDNYSAPNNTVDENGLDTAYNDGLTPVDTDGDTIPDYIDINSDNDIRDDIIEAWDFDSDGIPETNASGIDIDNDGLDDAYDNDTSQINPTNAQIPTDFPNVDYDVTFERDWREIMAIVVLISDVSAEEGNDLVFTISLVRYIDNSIPIQSPTPIEMTLFTTDGNDAAGVFNVAVSPFDYAGVSDFDIIIPSSTETFDFSVSSIDDNISEQDELFTLNANITSENTVNTQAEGIGTILDNEPLPTVTLNDDIVFEGEDLIYNISIDIPSSSPVEIDIVSVDNTATSPEDYVSIDITVIIEGTTDPSNPNLDGGSFSITTLLDNLNEPDEEVLLVLGNVTSNNVSNPNLNHTGTIIDLNPDPLAVISNDEVVEGNTLVFTISLLNEEGQPMANHLPVDFELETIDITTTENLDYPSLNEFRFIPENQSSLSIQIPTINDNLNENTEYMNLSATIISGDVSNLSNVLLGLGAIKDNDTPNLFSPNGDGQSDVFRIGNLDNFPDFKLRIFDRWGSEIYNYNNNGRANPQWWDGTKDGEPVIEGVYFYELDYNDGVTKPKTGFIQLIR